MFVKGNTLGLWDVRCRMFPVPRSKGQHQVWPANEESPAWIWTAPTVPGLFRIIGPRQLHPLTSPHSPPEFLPVPSGWQIPYDSFIPLMVLPSPPEPTVLQLPFPTMQWEQIIHPPVVGFPPPIGMEFIPIVPHMHTSSRRSSNKGWMDKKTPDCKVYFNNAIAVESTWGKSEDMNFFHGYKKPILKANQVAVALSAVTKPTSSAGSRPYLVVTPQSNNVTSSSHPSTQLLRQIYCLQRDFGKRNYGHPTTCDIKSVAEFDARDRSIDSTSGLQTKGTLLWLTNLPIFMSWGYGTKPPQIQGDGANSTRAPEVRIELWYCETVAPLVLHVKCSITPLFISG